MKINFFISFIIVLGLVVGIIYIAGADITFYIDFPSFVVAIVPMLVLVLAGFGPSGLKLAFMAGLGDQPLSLPQLKQARLILKSLGRYSYYASALGTLIGGIAILGNLDEMKQIGLGVGLAVLTIFYAIIINFIIVSPLVAKVDSRIIDQE